MHVVEQIALRDRLEIELIDIRIRSDRIRQETTMLESLGRIKEVASRKDAISSSEIGFMPDNPSIDRQKEC
jgi:hypothetical protein